MNVYLVFCLCVVLGLSESSDPDNQSDLEKRIEEILLYEGTYDPMTSRVQPWKSNENYVVTKDRLDEIRALLMYPYYDYDIDGQNGDLETNINNYNTQVNKQLTFLLPYFGFGLNYTWVSLNGYLGFSDAPSKWPSYPLHFPVMGWPQKPDPSFIAPFYSKCNIGQIRLKDREYQRTPGVYYRLERDLPSRTDQLGVEIRERLKWDIRTGMVGATIFKPKHAIIVTWKNVTFTGGSANTDAKFFTNTFQLVVTTDEIRTYALFNYEHMTWTTHTEASGSSDDGQGGIPAFVGFNAGNGTRAYEYTPYSQQLYIRDLSTAGNANGLPGRHIFRIDEVILAGTCRREETLNVRPLVFSPEHGNMLGGTLVNVTGPCFEESYRVTCQFDTTTTEASVIDGNTALCIMPQLYVSGYVDIAISINNGPFYWRGKFFVETPITSPQGVWSPNDAFHEAKPELIELDWLSGNLTQRADATVTISLWGYKETTISPQIIYIDVLAENVPIINQQNSPYQIDALDFSKRSNSGFLDLEMGFVMINLTDPEPIYGLSKSTVLWSKPIPLAWYFNSQWERMFGQDWTVSMCDRWTEKDRNLRNFAYEVSRCPCLLRQAVSDLGRFIPDYACDKDANTKCYYHLGADHCVRSALPNKDGAGQQCCYDRDGYLMMTSDQMWGGRPHRSHNFGLRPYDEANKVPSLSHWFHDMSPFYTCCNWQTEQSPGCINYRFERRASQDCVGYQPPTVASLFGDPHIYTFDNTEYTFNGLGEFVLVRVDSSRHILDVQGRFERIPKNYRGYAKGSMLTAVAAKNNVSSTVEVRARPINAMWRYHLDVIVDECIVYTPSNILNQSQVIITFSSGAGVEVTENRGYLGVRVYLPPTFANLTRGLFGNWTYRQDDDFVLPDGTELDIPNTSDLETIHKSFGMEWSLDDKEDELKGKSLFTHDISRSSNYYYKANFNPEYDMTPTPYYNSSLITSRINRICGDSLQCSFDYITTMRTDFAIVTKYYQDQYVNIRENALGYVTSCGVLPTPPNAKKSSFNYLAGAEVKYECVEGYVLLGEQRRWCYESGDWNWPEFGEAVCVTESEYMTMQNGIVAGTVLAILIPILLALLCFLAYCHHRVKQNQEARRKYFKATAPPRTSTFPKTDFHSSAPALHAGSRPSITKLDAEVQKEDSVPDLTQVTGYYPTEDDDSSTSASSTSYESSDEAAPPPFNGRSNSDRSDSTGREYYTREPLNNQPVSFQNRRWGVDRGSITSDYPNGYHHSSSISHESAV